MTTTHTTRDGHPVHTIDLLFQGAARTIGAYAIPHPGGLVLVECGPGSTLEALETGLNRLGYGPEAITHLLLTHIHLDHAGAAGHLARLGAHVYVHHVGAPHMVNPEKLLASAQRIYGDEMERLWGQFLPVPPEQLTPLHDGDEIVVGSLRFRALDTPGHANHHMVFLFEGLCFLGDIGGIRLPGTEIVRLPTPPPEFHLERWRESVQRLGASFEEHAVTHVAPTHFGIFDDPHAHLALVNAALDDVEAWMNAELPGGEPDLGELRRRLVAHTRERVLAAGFPRDVWEEHEAVMPTAMSADGLWRYWRKYRG
ncbi:MAG: MBL fold metallo-hydrolase [Ardenticatenia bacterium]|nr:MBL fold metallo-hydrolase [Ardenticatenia bacterium]